MRLIMNVMLSGFPSPLKSARKKNVGKNRNTPTCSKVTNGSKRIEEGKKDETNFVRVTRGTPASEFTL